MFAVHPATVDEPSRLVFDGAITRVGLLTAGNPVGYQTPGNSSQDVLLR